MIEESKDRIVNLSGLNDYHGELMETIDGKLLALLDTCSQMVAQKYTKPSSGIPKTDLAQAVQTSLGKADSALQASDIVQLQSDVAALQSLVAEGSNPTAAIDKFNEIVAFLANIENTESLDGIVAGINSSITTLAGNVYTKSAVDGLLAQKQDKIEDIQKIREGAEAALNGIIGANRIETVDLGLPSGTLWSRKAVGAGSDISAAPTYAMGELGGAVAEYGGEWGVPTKKQLEELLENTTMGPAVIYSQGATVIGVMFVSKINGAYITVPFAQNYQLHPSSNTTIFAREGLSVILGIDDYGGPWCLYSVDMGGPQLIPVTTESKLPVRPTLLRHIVAISNKVDKEDGKGLSANDYTDDDKAKVDKIVYATSADIHSLFEQS